MKFWTNEDGTATVDWTVVTAGIVMLGLSMGITISGAAGDRTDDIGASLDSMDPVAISESY